MYVNPKSKEMPKAISNCPFCKKEFSHFLSQERKFCSRECKNNSSERIEFSCINCEKKVNMLKSVYEGRKKATNTCSYQCYLEYIKPVPKVCIVCKNSFTPADHRTLTCCKKCFSEYVKTDGIRRRKGHWFENGYKVLYRHGDRCIKEHIQIIEKKIGRRLHENECVHHINGIRDDNRIENLMIMDKKKHLILHGKIRYDAVRFARWLLSNKNDEALDLKQVFEKLKDICPDIWKE